MADQDTPREPSPDAAESTQHARTTHRRRVLEVIAAGGGVLATSTFLPETWVKPVVDAIVVPAHAQGPTPRVPIVCSTFLCTVTGFAVAGGGSASTTARQTISSGTNLAFTSTLLGIPYSLSFIQSGQFTAAGCSGTSVVVSTITVPSGTANRMVLFTQRQSTTQQGTGTQSSLFRATVRDLGVFVFTSTCADT